MALYYYTLRYDSLPVLYLYSNCTRELYRPAVQYTVGGRYASATVQYFIQ